MFKVTGKTVERIIKRNGIDIKELSRKEKAEAFKEEAAIAKQYWDMYNQPMSLENVGKMFDLSDSTIRLVLIKHGYEIRKRGRLFNTAPTIRKPKTLKSPCGSSIRRKRRCNFKRFRLFSTEYP